MATLVFGQACGWAQPYGLEQRAVVGAFLNGALPPAESIPAAWQATPAYPNLTFVDPTTINTEPGGNRLFVGERQGKVYSFTNDPATTNKTLCLDLSPVTQGYNDSGLLGFVFHPEYGLAGSSNRNYFYIFYSYSPSPVGPSGQFANSDTDSYCRLSRFTMIEGTGVADPGSELVLINLFDRQLWHQGGSMFFGPDGFLYVSIGDEGADYDFYNTTQKIDGNLYSGVLRIDVDMDSTRSHPIRRQPIGATPPAGWPGTYTGNYFVPDDNPWVNTNGTNLEEYWAIGFRSPHRMSYDAMTDRIWLGDVGQTSWEEISIVERAGNYQWAYLEGTHANASTKPKPTPLIGTDRPPVHEYAHTDGNNCIIGGFVYRGAQYPSLYGKYIFGDNGSGRIWTLEYDGQNPAVVNLLFTLPFQGEVNGLTTFGLDYDNELLLTHTGTQSKIYRITAVGNPPPPPPALLSQTGAFTNLNTLEAAPELVPYTVNAPLWSDHADKLRWLTVPTDGAPYGPGETIGFSTNGNWSFPIGSVLVKHFDLPVDDTNPALLKRLETRFLVHATNSAWYGFTYKWREDNSDADLLLTSLRETNLIATATGTRTQVWYYPSPQDCLSCHNQNSGGVLGARTHQFNGTNYYPATGVVDNQLRTLNHIGLFATNLNEAGIPTLPKSHPLWDNSVSPEVRVRSYLDSNCSHCHQPNGARGFFDARYSTPLASQGIVEGALFDTLGIAGAKVVKTRSLAQSVLYQRDNATSGIQMPPLARSIVDTNYINLLAEWINNLPPALGVPAQQLGRIGNTNTGTLLDNITTPSINACRFQAASNLTVSLIRAQVFGISGNYKCAIYAESNSQPSRLLGYTTPTAAPTNGWYTLPLLQPVTLTNAQYYWLAVWSDDANGKMYYSGTANTLRFRQYPYGDWPDPIATTGSGLATYCIYATGGTPPQFVNSTPANRTIEILSPMTVTNTATDADLPFQSLTYYLLQSPANAAISTNGIITWTPQPAQAPSTNTFVTAVFDGVTSVSNSFQVIVTNGNTAPVAMPDNLTRYASQGVTAPTSVLLTNDTDADADTLNLVGLLGATPAGSTLTESNNSVTYWPPFANTNSGSFNYVVGDGRGGLATGLVTIAVMPDPAGTDVLAITAGPGAAVNLNLTGIPGFTYTVQFSDALTPPNWQNLTVSTANGTGQISAADTMPVNSTNRFYRAVRGIAP